MHRALYFTSPQCGVCQVLKPKLRQLFAERYPKIDWQEVDMQNQAELSGQHRVFTAPTLLIELEGKESARFVRNISERGVMEQLDRRYGLLFDKS